jgi:hypothetical protein
MVYSSLRRIILLAFFATGLVVHASPVGGSRGLYIVCDNNGICDAGEDLNSCGDCTNERLTGCGDGICEGDEEFLCPDDCSFGSDNDPPPPADCGNGICENGEEISCPDDCL